MSKVSVIIPAYNEGKRLVKMADIVASSGLADELVVVDDSSALESKKELGKIKGARVIELAENKGKSNALKIGFENSSGETIIFLDADLVNFEAKHLKLLIDKVSDGYDMILGELEGEFPLFRLIGMSTALTGERAFKREKIQENIRIFESQGYFIESEINKVFFRNNRVGRVILKGVSQEYKVQKIGVRGWFNDLSWLFTYFSKVGLREIFYQLSSVKRKIKLLN